MVHRRHFYYLQQRDSVLCSSTLVMSKPIVSKFGVVVPKSYTVTYSSIEKYPPSKQLLLLYKRFYKLRLYQYGESSKLNYESYIKRKFKYENFNTRRKIFLDRDFIGDLPTPELVHRIVNTLAFVQNASVYNQTVENDIRLRGDKNVSKEHSGPYEATLESQILATILNMEYSMPSSVKFDQSYSWVDELKEVVLQAEQTAKGGAALRKQENKLALLGYGDFQENLMKLNESYKLCL